MNTGYVKTTTSIWLHFPRVIDWKLYMGKKRNLIVEGHFQSSLTYINNQGEKWGDTYIREVGMHYDDYANWDSRQRFHPIPASGIYVNSPYELRLFKDAAGGVTGLIGEVLTVIFLQKSMNIPPYHIAHIKQTSKIKSPDFLVQINQKEIYDLISGRAPQAKILTEVSRCTIDTPMPIECKSRRNGTTRLSSALMQLVDYWRVVNSSAGYGIAALINLVPQTSIDFLLFLPKPGEQKKIIKTIQSDFISSDNKVKNFTEKHFFEKLGGYFLV